MPISQSAMARSLTRGRNFRSVSPAQPAVADRGTSRIGQGRSQAMIESLETRTHLSVSKDAAGFTVVTPENGSRVIYVSALGKDTNTGLSSTSPIKSISKGISLLRSGTGDQLLFKRGETFSGNFGIWSKSGHSASEPLVIGSYGTGSRAVINTGASYGLAIGSKNPVNNLYIQGIKLIGDGVAVADGIAVAGTINNMFMEDVEITKYVNNIVLQKYFGPVTNITVRRSIITDAFSRSSRNSQGLFAEGVAGLTLEENVFDHNGWGNGKSATVYYHNAYVRSTTSGLVARGNVFSNGSSHGLQARGGGIIENNVFINNATGLSFGLVNGSPVTPGGVTGRVVNNVFVDTHNIGGNPRGVAMEIGNVKRGGTLISGNVIANGDPLAKLPAITLAVGSGNDNASQAVGINDLTISNNVVYNWSIGFWVNAGMAPGTGQKALNNLNVSNNHFQNIATYNAIIRSSMAGSYSNNFFTTKVLNKAATNPGGIRKTITYVDASRTPGKSVGGTNQTYVSLARTLGKSAWNVSYLAKTIVDYMKAGFTAK
ncbi:right-handed parallel beta-helix repeat-containing protein [Humisphaera borealis]|uniref:Right handed beta helix domain-containing protein n=1 Tax=Humisphaera borealis TaxID=2807512 RepID=A0A7M2WXC7_9BACT|nr:hypothetical protein [Humisphaera borealis]QOV90053.1 hypothetical protein IPV69_01375 [Humisphaera borealis]